MIKKIFLTFILCLLCSSCSVLSIFNAGTVHLKYLKSRASFNNELYENRDELGNTSFSIRNVQHPSKIGKWNFNVRLSPSIHLDNIAYVTQGTELDPDSGEQVPLPTLYFRRFSLLGNLKFSFHTPAGAFVLSGGYGGAVYRLKNNQGYRTIKTSDISRVDFVWVAFMSKRFFVLMGPRYYNDGNEQYYFAFRLGYFWGST